METPRRTRSTCLLIWGLVAALLSHNVFSASSLNLQDQKNFYFPPFDPSFGLSPPVAVIPPIVPSPPISYSTSPPPTYGSPPTHSSPPSHGSGGGTTPVHDPPSHGGSGGGHHHGRTPPTNCGNPTPHRSPPRHVNPSPPTHHNPSTAPPAYHFSPPPSGGGGGGGGGGSTPTPIVLPPTTPGIPMIPSPPFDPNSPPIGGTCDFWRNHPTIIWGLFGFWGPTVGSAFGVTTLPGTGAHLNLLQALQNTKPDGISALYREGTASLLNSMVNKNFPYSTSHVKDSFVAAIGSNKAAAAQARVFRLANEGHMKLRV